MTKFKAALIHLIMSVIAITALFLIVYFIWYPRPFFEISGTIEPFKLLILIDVIVGPLLTFVVYKKGKKTLVMDLSVIAILQISALVYGAHTIYQGRPTLIVMNQGKFIYLVDKFANYEGLKDESLLPHFLSQPKYAYDPYSPLFDEENSLTSVKPIDDFGVEIYPSSLSFENIAAKFPQKSETIESLKEKYSDQDVLFFLLEKGLEQYYVLYSKNQNRIVDRLKF